MKKEKPVQFFSYEKNEKKGEEEAYEAMVKIIKNVLSDFSCYGEMPGSQKNKDRV